jgi:cyclophilin family peptidyl-prolyl cis-trans isomerase/protein-disulfide isomerase
MKPDGPVHTAVFRPTWTFRMMLSCLLILVAACTPAAPNAPSPAASIVPTSTPRSLPTLVEDSLTNTMDCIVVSGKPASAGEEQSIFPPARDGDHVWGSPEAAVVFMVYTDFQSPAAAALDEVLRDLLARYPEHIRLVQRSFPVPASDKGVLAAAAVEAAGRQEHYWEMSRIMFTTQVDWTGLDSSGFQDWVNRQAEEIGLDPELFGKDLRDPQIKLLLDQAQRFGLENGIPVIPFMLVNGQIYQGPRDLRSLDSLVSLLRLEALQFTECPPFIIDISKSYTAELQTTRGAIVVQLFAENAPQAVNNFVFLSRQGWYDGVPFHRVIDDLLAQAGDPSGSGYGSPGYAFPDEIGTFKFDRPGVLAMANLGPDSNGSQFFITFRAVPEMDGKHTIFGQVLSGMDVLAALTRRDPAQPVELAEPDRILRVIILEK